MDIQTRVLLEGNLANEVGLIVLDTIELFCGHFKVNEGGKLSSRRLWLFYGKCSHSVSKQVVKVMLSFFLV